MNIRFFFQGKLSREEASSAFLATLLEQRPDFRAYFFNLCDVGDRGLPRGREWRVVTEDRDFDVFMDCRESDWVVLIENKIKSGSITPGQLSNYYAKLRNNQDNQQANILLVYLTPKPGTGQAEFMQMKNSPDLAEGDYLVHLSWDDIFDYVSLLEEADAQHDFITSGFDAIKQHIESSLQEKYTLTNGREQLDEIAALIVEDLGKAFPHINFRRWRGADASSVYTVKSDITVYIKAITKYDPDTNEPDNLLNPDGTLNVILEVSMNISGLGSRKPSVRQQWASLVKDNLIQVPGLEDMVPSKIDPKWFVWHSEVVTSPKEQVQSQLLIAGKAVLTHMAPFFGSISS